MNIQGDQSTDFNSGQMHEPESSTQGVTQQLAEKSKETARRVKQRTREAKETVMEKGAETAEQLRDRSAAYAQERKTQLGERIHGYGSAVRRAADKLREEQDPNLAHYTEAVAERLDQAADYVQSRDVGMILRDVENTARRHPEIFFGGMFVAGLALSRFFKASSKGQEYEGDNEDYWVEDEEVGSYQEDPLSMDSNMEQTIAPDFGDATSASPSGAQERQPEWQQNPTTAPGGNI